MYLNGSSALLVDTEYIGDVLDEMCPVYKIIIHVKVY